MKQTAIIFAFLILVAGGCKSKNGNTPEQTIREFYTQYITECDKTPYNAGAVDKLMENYLSKALIIKLTEATLDYDPFLNAQDCEVRWLETLEINPVLGPGMDDAYRICYNAGDAVCLTLFLKQYNGKWLIDDIEGLSNMGNVVEEANDMPLEDIENNLQFREIALEEKIGSRTLGDHLNDPAIPQVFKDVFLQHVGVNDDEETLALVDSLSSTDRMRHPFYFVLATRTLWWSDGAFSEALAIAVKEYVEKHTQEFLDYFSTEKTLTESDLKQWSEFTFYEIVTESENIEDVRKQIEYIRELMKKSCNGCSPDKIKMIHLFADNMHAILL